MLIEDYIRDVPPKCRHLYPPPQKPVPKAALLKSLLERTLLNNSPNQPSMQVPTSKQSVSNLNDAIPGDECQSPTQENPVFPKVDHGAGTNNQAHSGVNAGTNTSVIEDEQKKARAITRFSGNLRQTTYAQHLKAIMKPYLSNDIGYESLMCMMGEIYREYGCPDDPMVKQLIQQIVLYHELIAIYHRKAQLEADGESMKIMLTAANQTSEAHRKAVTQLRQIIESLPKRVNTLGVNENIASVNNQLKHPTILTKEFSKSA